MIEDYEKMKRKVRLRYEARSRGRSYPDSFGFLSLRNAQTIEPTTSWVPDDRINYCLGCSFLP